MALLAEGLGALDLRGLTVSEIARICGSDGLAGVQLVFVDGRCLTVTVWTDWTLLVELRSEAVVPDYLPQPGEDGTRVPLEEFADSNIVINEVVPGFNEVGELMKVRFTLDNQQLLLRSFGGNLVMELG